MQGETRGISLQHLIHRVLRLVSPFFDLDVDLESVRQGPQQANPQGQTYCKLKKVNLLQAKEVCKL